MKLQRILAIVVLLALISCQTDGKNTRSTTVDYLIVHGLVYDGSLSKPEHLNVGICGEKICYIGTDIPQSNKVIDATGLIVTPGFIDPHTHSLDELYDEQKRSNLNYLTQGVTTVINGNDGGGSPKIKQIADELKAKGIGTNLALFVGHGEVREVVMGREERAPTETELAQMKALVAQAMQEGALGLSSGLYYVPGVYSETEEVIELAKVAATFGGVYDTHLRDESTFNVGFLKAIEEAIKIAREANIHLHIAHIKALGVDVWGQSEDAIRMIANAHKNGVSISADQYPWQASGTNIHSAIMPSWVRADSLEKFHQRLLDPDLQDRIRTEVKENIRRRGGASALLVTESKVPEWLGKTLQEISKDNDLPVEQMAIKIALKEKARVASFNMSADDIKNFMSQEWVVSSSDGTNGHPRKYASFPKKYQKYVKEQKVLSLEQYIHKSSGKTAQIFGIKNRGFIQAGNYADINLIDLKRFKANADFSNWNKLSTGVEHQFVNGKPSISDGGFTNFYWGKFISR